MRNNPLYKKLKEVTVKQVANAAAVEGLSIEDVRVMAGVSAGERTVTFLENMRLSLANELQTEQDESIVQWIIAQIQGQFPLADGAMRRGRIVEIHLDGYSEEDEE
jgi:hypothetical protein